MKRVGFGKSRTSSNAAPSQSNGGLSNGIIKRQKSVDSVNDVSILGNGAPGGGQLAFPGSGTKVESTNGFFKGSKVSLSNLFHTSGLGTLSRKKVKESRETSLLIKFDLSTNW